MSKSSIRRLLPLLMLLTALLCPIPAWAQQELQIEQSVSAVYGESITFSADASSTTSLISAELVVHVLNWEVPITIPVSVQPGNDVTVSTTVLVASLNLPPAATIEYQWIFNNEAGNPLSGDITSYRYADTSVPWAWEPDSREEVTVFSSEIDPALQNAILEIAIAARRNSEDLLGRKQNAPIAIYVYPSLASLAASLRAHRVVVQDWVAAYTIPDQGIIFVSATPGPDLIDNLRRDLSHEIMHLAVYSIAGDQYEYIPAWFNEGLALNTNSGTDTALGNVLSDALQSRVLLSTQALCLGSFSGLDPHDAALAYAQSASLVSYIVGRYGTSQISALMAAFSSGLGCSEGVELALGISLADLEQQWLQSLSITAARSESQSIPLITWGVIWLASVTISLLFIAPQPRLDSDQPLFTTQPSLPRIPSSGEDIPG